jgi:hypothetical protein
MGVLFFTNIVVYCNLTATQNGQFAYHFSCLSCKLGKIHQTKPAKLNAVTSMMVTGSIAG